MVSRSSTTTTRPGSRVGRPAPASTSPRTATRSHASRSLPATAAQQGVERRVTMASPTVPTSVRVGTRPPAPQRIIAPYQQRRLDHDVDPARRGHRDQERLVLPMPSAARLGTQTIIAGVLATVFVEDAAVEVTIMTPATEIVRQQSRIQRHDDHHFALTAAVPQLRTHQERFHQFSSTISITKMFNISSCVQYFSGQIHARSGLVALLQGSTRRIRSPVSSHRRIPHPCNPQPLHHCHGGRSSSFLPPGKAAREQWRAPLDGGTRSAG